MVSSKKSSHVFLWVIKKRNIKGSVRAILIAACVTHLWIDCLDCSAAGKDCVLVTVSSGDVVAREWVAGRGIRCERVKISCQYCLSMCQFRLSGSYPARVRAGHVPVLPRISVYMPSNSRVSVLHSIQYRIPISWQRMCTLGHVLPPCPTSSSDKLESTSATGYRGLFKEWARKTVKILRNKSYDFHK